MKERYTVTIEKLIFGGQGLARLGDVGNPRFNGKTVFVWNALPGEVLEIDIVKNKKTYLEAIAVNILEPSPERITPKEDHFLSTSPWQIISFDREQYWKKAIAAETYSKIGDLILNDTSLDITTDGNTGGYRNKMEFSFTEEHGKIHLAFFERGGKERFVVEQSSLAMPVINTVSTHILDWIRDKHIPLRSLKTLIVRANTAGETIAALFIKDKLTFETYPALLEKQRGFQLYYSTHKSPAAVPTKLLYTVGKNTLTQDILGTSLAYGIFSFFQINPPIFEMALKDMAAFLDPKKPLLDFYAGVGAISLPIAMNREETILVESNKDAAAFARENIALNHTPHAEVYDMPAEHMTDVIDSNKQIILDPPRAGLHVSVIQKLLSTKPERIIYLSCNLSTQARDMKMLSEHYKPMFFKLYNFFPRTPHIEGLVVLEKV
ncbi:MAG: hypothetical protein AUJ37_03705 [Candidatus Magasanikbacteria bacterium CG1_02_41_34]|nr:MAG: hypothetical protein AUJ37_03705 [Candidatus Magasanikbacteria bacterium CG1_02_41_34]